MKSRKWIILAEGTAVVAVIVAFLTNPDQAAHFRAIKETIALRKPGSTDISWVRVNYQNYLVFSTTGTSKMTFTYGYFGKVQTNDISFFWETFPLVSLHQTDPPPKLFEV